MGPVVLFQVGPEVCRRVEGVFECQGGLSGDFCPIWVMFLTGLCVRFARSAWDMPRASRVSWMVSPGGGMKSGWNLFWGVFGLFRAQRDP